MNVADLHGAFEQLSPKGVGAAVDLQIVQGLAKTAIAALQNPIKGVNREIVLPLSGTVVAAFDVVPASFDLNLANAKMSLDVSVWLHRPTMPQDRILTIPYSLKDEPLGVEVDQAASTISLVPRSTSTITPGATQIGPHADDLLIAAGYVDGAGNADWARFNQEVYFPFLWNVAQGLARSIIRSVPVPQPLAALGVIRAVPPIKAKLMSGHLMVWSESAAVLIPDCAAETSPIANPTANIQVRPGSPPPSAPFDKFSAPYAIYVASTPILNWHSGVLKPAVMISQSGGGVVGWRFDAAAGLETVLVELVPASNGGSIEAQATLRLIGVASAWLNTPCGSVGLISGAVTANGFARGALSVSYEKKAGRVLATFAVQGGINNGSVDIVGGGLFGQILGEIAEWLIHLGAINIEATFAERGETMLWDGARLSLAATPALTPRMRVGRGSALVAVFVGDREASAGESQD